jgi:hypothetical protein
MTIQTIDEAPRKFVSLAQLIVAGRTATRAGIEPHKAARALLGSQGITGVVLCLALPVPSESVWYDVDVSGPCEPLVRDALAALTLAITVRPSNRKQNTQLFSSQGR